MKIPELLFVRHCPNLSPERKQFLTPHLDERVGNVIKEIHWVEDYNHDHPLVEWIGYTQKIPYGPKLLSNLVKTLYICKELVKSGHNSTIMTTLHQFFIYVKNW